MSKFQAIAADIQRSIEDGSLKPGDKLPTVVELCELYGVSKITVKRAMDEVIEAGLVTSRRGSGSYVKDVARTSSGMLDSGRSDRATGFTAEHAESGQRVSTVVYEFEIVTPPSQVAEYLNIAEDDFAYHDIRVRCTNDVPIVIENTYMPIEVIPGLKRKHLESSIYSYIQHELGLKISSFHRTIRAVRASAEEATRLHIEPNDPLLELEQIGFLDSGVAFEYSVSRNVGDRYELHNVTLA